MNDMSSYEMLEHIKHIEHVKYTNMFYRIPYD